MDEVDAPLDDNNIILFNGMIKSLSHHVQFVMITHNKKSIATANQLVGITMRELGVSRQVTVNMDDAFAMTES